MGLSPKCGGYLTSEEQSEGRKTFYCFTFHINFIWIASMYLVKNSSLCTFMSLIHKNSFRTSLKSGSWTSITIYQGGSWDEKSKSIKNLKLFKVMKLYLHNPKIACFPLSTLSNRYKDKQSLKMDRLFTVLTYVSWGTFSAITHHITSQWEKSTLFFGSLWRGCESKETVMSTFRPTFLLG